MLLDLKYVKDEELVAMSKQIYEEIRNRKQISEEERSQRARDALGKMLQFKVLFEKVYPNIHTSGVIIDESQDDWVTSKLLFEEDGSFPYLSLFIRYHSIHGFLLETLNHYGMRQVGTHDPKVFLKFVDEEISEHVEKVLHLTERKKI